VTWFLGYAVTASAGTRTVTTLQDGGAGSLRQAILDAQPGDTIVFSASAFNTPQTLQLVRQIEISKSLTINGSGSGVVTPTLSAAALTRTLQVDEGVTLTLNQLNLNNADCHCEGGAIYVSTGASLVVSHSMLYDNKATVGGAIFNKGVVSLSDTSLTHNSASYGGAIHNYGTLSANRVIIAENSAVYGGAVRNIGVAQAAHLIINNSAIYNNSASEYGGGIHDIYPANVIMTNTTWVNNSAAMDGGAMWNGADTELSVLNTTIYANSSGNSGGGIASAGRVTLTNSILSANTGGNCAVQAGTVTDLGGNIEDASTCGLGAFVMTASRSMTNPLLGAFGIECGAFERQWSDQRRQRCGMPTHRRARSLAPAG